MGIDGVVFDVPAPDANAFGRPSAGPLATRELFRRSASSARSILGLSGRLRRATLEPGETGMVGPLLRHLDPEMLLLWDQFPAVLLFLPAGRKPPWHGVGPGQDHTDWAEK